MPLPKEKDEGKVLRVVGGKWVPDSNVATLDENGKIASALLQLDATLSDTSENPVMNRVVKAAFVALGSGTKMATGTYVGTDTAGKDGATSLTLPFTPKLIIIIVSRSLAILMPDGGVVAFDTASGSTELIVQKIAAWGTTCSWYQTTDSTFSDYQMNSNSTHQYVAFGEESYTAWDGGEY